MSVLNVTCANDNRNDVQVKNLINVDGTKVENGYLQLQQGKVPNLKKKGIKFAHLNVHSLIGKIDEFRHLCGDIFDVLCVNETLCDHTISDDELELEGYNILRCDRKRDGGGVAVYIKDQFNFKRRLDLCDNTVECIWVEVTPPHMSSILICAVYNPDGKNNVFSTKLSSMLTDASTENKEIVLLGDFNCDFTTGVSSKQINDLKFVFNMFQLQQLINLPTRVTPTSKTIIDLFCTSNCDLYKESGVIQTAISDHYMIYAIRNSRPIKAGHKIKNYRCFKEFNEHSFVNDLFQMPWSDIARYDNVNDALQMWESMFLDVTNRHLPKKCKRVKSSPAPWLDGVIKQKMLRRDSLHRLAVRTNNVTDWEAYKSLRNHVTSMIRSAKSNYYKDLISQNCNNSCKLWQSLKSVLPSKGSINTSSIVFEGNVLTSNDNISNGFNKHFANVATKLIDECNRSCNVNDINVNGATLSDVSSVLDLPLIGPDFVDKEICSMSANKAIGLDDVSSRVLKLARPAIVDSLTYIINLSLSTGTFPSAWKEAKVIPLHKGGDLDNTNNYRPISILPVVSKIIERAVHNHVYSYLSAHNILNEHQSGFRPKHSTETALVDMVDDWLTNINSGKMTGVAFIDLRKAFDTVNHGILIDKLRLIGASSITLKWFRSYLSGRMQSVTFKDTISSKLPVNIGVPQGSILGPLLFLIFINDMSKVIKHGKISMYADDTTLYVNDNDVNVISKKLTEDIHEITAWLRINKLFLNTEKTNIMLVGSSSRLRRVHDDEFTVIVNGLKLNRVKKAKCLGVVIDDELLWHKQVNGVTQKLFCKIALLRRLSTFLDSNTLNILYKSLVQPHFDYCSVVWFGRFIEDIHKLNVLQKRCARIILSVNSLTSSTVMFPKLGWKALQDRCDYFKTLLLFKTLNNLAPTYLCNKFKYVSEKHNVNTRQAAAGLLALPPCTNGSDTDYLKSSFCYSAVEVWNKLNYEVRKSTNVQNFKYLYKQ